MTKLMNPPEALLPSWTRDSVELGGSQCIIAIDQEKHFINFTTVFSELSMGQFWKDSKISNEIEKITMKYDDSDAIYNPDIMIERIVAAFEKIMEKKILYFGLASFEGNAFERTVFDEIELSSKDADYLLNIYKKKRQKSDYPQIRKGNYVEINFFGEATPYFSLPNKKFLREIASSIYSSEGNASGIVCSAQGAANFIILTENIAKIHTEKQTTIDKKNLRQMFHLIERNIVTPISWFRIDLGLNGLSRLQNWDDIKDDLRIINIKNKYLGYVEAILSQKDQQDPEQILLDDIGKPIDITKLNEKERLKDLEDMMDAINILNEMELESESLNLLYYPPTTLLSSANQAGSAIGGAMALLSIDVGKNIFCLAELRDYVMWGKYYRESDQEDKPMFDDFQENKFFDLENPLQLCDIYIRSFQKVMKNSQLFLGMLELENNAFEFSLFQEIDLDPKDISRLQSIYYKNSNEGKFPKLIENHIKLKWFGVGKEYFTNEDCLGILDLADKISHLPPKLYCAGIVCIGEKSTWFYILNSNFEAGLTHSVDNSTLSQMFEHLNYHKTVPFCWFKISLGIDTLKMHKFWFSAFQYTDLLLVLENYRKYILELVAFKKKEDKYRIYR